MDETLKDAVSSNCTSMTPVTVIESKESETTSKTSLTSTEDATQVTSSIEDRSKLPSRLSQVSQKLPHLNLAKTPSLPESIIATGSGTSSPATVPIASTSASASSARVKSPNLQFDFKKQLSSGDLTPASESTMATLAIANSSSLGALSRSVENLDELPESETPGYEITSTSDPSTTFDPTTIVER